MSAQEAISLEQPPAAQRAFGSSFYLGMRILPRAQREAMFEIYAFCRAVDDIADSTLARPERLRQLEAWRRDIDAIYAGTPPAPPAPLVRLAAIARAFSLERADFIAVIDGMEMDALADIRAPDTATLDLYCDRVACAVGRLSVRVFGLRHDEGRALADHLGRALQLTNILRDLDEDAEVGRLYLPREALQAAGILTDDPAAVLAHPALARACAPVIARAHTHFEEADAIMARCPRRAARAPRIMSAVYKIILADIAARGFAPPRPRVRVSRARLVWILLSNAIV
ncbi:MAG TPA: presqualene diphosphate synthase HpnD [Xanthobacteraceae bacterium]|nr:presqualene diphosphate synthase HpnD [Xanthobacteraceae bacterium]